jgi:organic hydroperoxide reductase OsmC/OhrA
MADIKVTATVRLHKEESGFFIDAALDAELAGVDQQQAEALVAKAHTGCGRLSFNWCAHSQL